MSSQNGCNGASGDDSPVIVTTDEEGAEHRFQMIDMIEVEGKMYGLLLYLTETGEAPEPSEEEGYVDDEVVVMRIIDEDGQHVFEAIEDEDEFAKVVAYVEQMELEEEEEEGASADFEEN